MYCYRTFLFEHDIITLSVYVCFIVFRHGMAEILLKVALNTITLTPGLSIYSKALGLKHFLKS